MHDRGKVYAIRRVFFLVVAILLIAALLSPVVAARDVRVALTELRPSVFTDDQGRPAGLFVDIIEDIANKEGWNVIWVHGTLSESWDRLASGEIDLVMGVVSTPEREILYDFNHEPALSAWSQVYAPPGSDIDTILDLDGKRVALLRGDANGIAFRDYAKKFDINLTYIEKDSLDAVFAGTVTGDADAVVVFSLASGQSADKHGLSQTPVMFNPASIVFAVPEGKNQDLLAAIDRYLLEGKSDPASTYSHAMQKWFGMKGSSSGIPPQVWWSLAGIAGLAALFVIMSLVLRREVRRKTRELSRQNEELQAAYAQLTMTEEELREKYHELERSEQALRQARRKLNLLNTLTFEDIRNGVFSVAGYIELAKKEESKEAVKTYLAKMESIWHTIDSSLRFAKTYQDLGMSQARWQDVNYVLVTAISHLDFSRISRTVTLDGLEIYADPLLENVFFNLMENILRHGTGATAVTVSYRKHAAGVTIRIEDNGPGIPAPEKERIFERGNTKKGGSGLFLVREILSITDIAITENGEAGKGARFEIMVPEGEYRIPKKE